jgi:hypothetical protein
MHRPPRLLGLALAPLLVLAACGGDDGGEDPGAESADTTGVAANACPEAVFDGTIRREADPISTGHVPVELDGEDVVDGLAVPIADTLTIYLATFDLDEERIGETLVAPEGETLVTLNVGREPTTDPGGVALIVDSGGGSTSSGAVLDGGYGLAPIQVDDERVCLSVRIEKDHESVDGTVSVPVAAFP